MHVKKWVWLLTQPPWNLAASVTQAVRKRLISKFVRILSDE
jgi:hypothetical protein